MSLNCALLILSLFSFYTTIGQEKKSNFQEIIRVQIGEESLPVDALVKLKLIRKIQNYSNNQSLESNNVHDSSIHSPKSVIFLKNGKMYVNSLEGFSTIVYETGSWEKLKVIEHTFEEKNSYLFRQEIPFNYSFKDTLLSYNIFKGKPVEFTTSHKEKYLWISYYRRSFDVNAIQPSAMAIVDTQADTIVKVLATGPLPKMISTSEVTEKLAVTHWGDNTVALLSIAGDTISDFDYEKHFIVDKKRDFSNYNDTTKSDRDTGCGACLRGTAFSVDGKFLFVGRMGGEGKIEVFDVGKQIQIGSIPDKRYNIRHLVIKDDMLYVSTNITGYVQKASIQSIEEKVDQGTILLDWKEVYVGKGVRTIVVSEKNKVIFATVNSENKVVVIDEKMMKIIAEIPTDSYPVGMALSPDERWLAVTAQGKKGKGGHSISIYEIDY